MIDAGVEDTGVNCYADGSIMFAMFTNQNKFKTNYPAFEFAYYYGKNGHNITSGSTFKNGWYLPSESELNDIYQANKTDNVIENALEVTGGDKFNGTWYWSSSQYASNAYLACTLGFNSGAWGSSNKTKSSCVCAIRAFN